MKELSKKKYVSSLHEENRKEAGKRTGQMKEPYFGPRWRGIFLKMKRDYKSKCIGKRGNH